MKINKGRQVLNFPGTSCSMFNEMNTARLRAGTGAILTHELLNEYLLVSRPMINTACNDTCADSFSFS